MAQIGKHCDTLSTSLARVLGQIYQDPLSEEIILKTKCCMVDFLAACFAAKRTRTREIAFNVVRYMGPGQRTLVGRKETGSLLGACLYNGMIAHAEELDDSHRYVSGLHLGAVVIPAAMAAAEDRHLSGLDFITAVVAGYEAAGRVCRCIDQEHRQRGFHSTGTIGPFGSCAAAGVALKFDEATLINAIGLAGSTGAGLFAFLEDGATVKHFHPGRAAMDGVMVALLASQGLTGPASVFEAREGFFHAYAGDFDAAPLLRPLDTYEISSAYHKLHSACGHSFPAIDAALALRKQISGNWRSVKRLELRSYRSAAALNNVHPLTVQEAKFSIPFLVGLALVNGRVSRFDLTPETLSSPDILGLASRTAIIEDTGLQDEFPRLRAGILNVELVSGQVIENRVDSPRGMPDNPISYEEICQKFIVESADCATAEEQSKILTVVHRLESLQSVNELTSLLGL